MAQQPGAQPMLLLMPDISGFTQFVNATEINHSQHIISELLQVLIDSNTLGMTISEIEGDAILFFKAGNLPNEEEVVEQCRKMFIAFHRQIKKYDLLRICDCGACSTTSQLTLKMVAHKGDVSFMNINKQAKLFGPDVILIHRLMKNDIPEHEYMLLTDKFETSRIGRDKKQFEWVQFDAGSSTYDVGKVDYQFSHFKSLYNSIPEPERPETKVYRVKKPLITAIEINAPKSFVYAKFMDFNSRKEFLPGVLRLVVEDEPHNRINKIGTQHECIRESPQSPSQTAAVELSENRNVLTETATQQAMSFDYIIEKTGEESCRVTFSVHLPMNPLKQLMFSLMMKNKFINMLNSSLAFAKEVIEKSYKDQEATVHEGHAHVK